MRPFGLRRRDCRLELEQLERRDLPSWVGFPSPNPSVHGDVLKGMAAVSGTDCWAVGYTDETSGAQSKTITEHWNGTSWAVVPSVNPGSSSSMNAGNRLTAVTAVASNDVWAVGYYWQNSLFQTLVEHWNGSAWSVVPSPSPGATGNNLLNAVKAVAANDVWAVGYYENANGAPVTLTEHWNGSAWSVVPSPSRGTGNNLTAVGASSSADVWAVGAYYNNSTGIWDTLTEHWNGSTWSIVPSPSPGRYRSNLLNGVAVVAPNNVWAVGNYEVSWGATETLIEHWNGTSWTIVPSPNVSTAYGSANVLNAVTAVSANDIWAVGFFQNAGTGHQHKAFTLHWNGTAWSVVSAPTRGKAAELNAAVAVAGHVWAGGAYSVNGNDVYTGDLMVPQTYLMRW